MGETSVDAGEQRVAGSPGVTEGAPATATGPAAWARARVLGPLYVAAAVVLTWPLAPHMGDHLAYGAEPTTTVPLFNLWTLRWGQGRLSHGFAGYWDAPLFHPATGTFALSEPQPLTTLAFAPLSWVTGNPVLAFNLVALAIFVLNGWFGARLARHLGVGAGPAALTGLVAMGLPFVASQMGVLQLTVVFPLFALVDALVRWAPEGGRRPAAEVGAWTAVTFLTCGYYGLFGLVGVFPPALLLARRSWLRWSRLGDVAIAAACLVPALPFLLGQAHLTASFERSDETIKALSATVGEFFLLPGDAVGAGLLPWVGDAGHDIALYMGTALLALGIGGAVVLDRQEGERLRAFGFLVGGAVVTLVLALGLNLSVFGIEPYQAVRTLVPGYRSLRSPFRFVALTEVFLVGLAAFGIEDLWRWRPGAAPAGRGSGEPVPPARTGLDGPEPGAPAVDDGVEPGAPVADIGVEPGEPVAGEGGEPERMVPSGGAGAPSGWARRAGALAAAAVVAAALVEVAIVPVDLFRVDRSTADWVAWLDDGGAREVGRPVVRDEDEPDEVVAFLPVPLDGKVASYAPTVEHMLEVLDAGQGVTTIDGYSGLWPQTYEDWQAAAINYPTDQADALLRTYGVTLIVVDADWLADRPDVVSWLGDRYVEQFTGPDHVVYAVPPTNGSASVG
jgi:hypothetical protein